MTSAASSPSVVLLTGAGGALGSAVARGVLAAGGAVAVAVPRAWQVTPLREQLGDERVLVSVVAPRDAEAAAGFVKGANDALGPVTAFVGAARECRAPAPGREPAGDLEQLLDANLHGNATLARAVLPALRRRGGALRFVGAPPEGELATLSATTRASLAALRAYAAGLAADLEGAGVSVAVVDAPLDDDAAARALLASLAPAG